MGYFGDYHTHTIYSKRKGIPSKHAEGTLEDNIKQASELGLLEIAITDHGFNHKLYCTYRKNMPHLKSECKRLGQKYNINVLLGVESNLISMNGHIDVTKEDMQQLDIVLCGFHNIVKSQSIKDKFKLFYLNFFCKFFGLSKTRIKHNTQAYIKAIENNNIDVIVHPNKGAVKVDIIEVAKAANKKGTLIEINSRALKLKKEEVKQLVQMGTMFIVNSDAHKINSIAHFKKAIDFIKENNIPEENIANLNKLPTFLNYKRK